MGFNIRIKFPLPPPHDFVDWSPPLAEHLEPLAAALNAADAARLRSVLMAACTTCPEMKVYTESLLVPGYPISTEGPLSEDSDSEPVSVTNACLMPIKSTALSSNAISNPNSRFSSKEASLSSTSMPNHYTGLPAVKASSDFRDFPQSQDPKPIPPAWLIDSLNSLRTKYPADRFKIVMPHTLAETPRIGRRSYPIYKSEYVPRIKCLDCCNMLFFAGPETTVRNFEDHLTSPLHRQKVAAARLPNSAGSIPPKRKASNSGGSSSQPITLPPLSQISGFARGSHPSRPISISPEPDAKKIKYSIHKDEFLS